jgi:hypothetical protein
MLLHSQTKSRADTRMMHRVVSYPVDKKFVVPSSSSCFHSISTHKHTWAYISRRDTRRKAPSLIPLYLNTSIPLHHYTSIPSFQLYLCKVYSPYTVTRESHLVCAPHLASTSTLPTKISRYFCTTTHQYPSWHQRLQTQGSPVYKRIQGSDVQIKRLRP